MVQQLGNIAAGQEVVFLFPTAGADGASVAFDTNGTVAVYKDGDATTADTAGVTYTASYNSVTGLNRVVIDTSGAFYAVGHDYVVVLTGAVLPTALTVNTVLAEFSILHRTAALPPIDGLTADQVLIAVLATAAGKVTVTDNGDGTYTALFLCQDGTTTALSVTYDSATGARAVTATIP